MKEINGALDAKGQKIGIVVGRFNSFLTEQLVKGAVDAFVRMGGDEKDLTLVRVPGAYEIPLAAKRMAMKKFDAVVALGAVVQGATAHADLINQATAKSFCEISVETGVPIVDGIVAAENLEQALRAIAAEHANKRVFVVSNAEPIIATLARLEPSMPSNLIMSVPPLEVVERLSDKVQFAELCQEHGLDVAETEVVRFGPDAPSEIAPTQIPFPLVVKPAYSPEYAAFIARGFQKVYYLHEQAELDELWAQLRAAGFVGTMLVQELIEGDDTYMDSITMYVNGAGESCLLASAHVLLEDHAPTMLGNPVAMITQQVPDLWAHAAELLAAVGYRGFANFDVKRDPKTGRRIFFEVNTRIGRNSYYVCAGGVNPMRIAVEDLVDGVRHETVVAEDKILYTLVPIKLATIERQKVSLSSDLWRSVVDATGQEFWFSPDAKAAVMP